MNRGHFSFAAGGFLLGLSAVPPVDWTSAVCLVLAALNFICGYAAAVTTKREAE